MGVVYIWTPILFDQNRTFISHFAFQKKVYVAVLCFSHSHLAEDRCKEPKVSLQIFMLIISCESPCTIQEWFCYQKIYHAGHRYLIFPAKNFTCHTGHRRPLLRTNIPDNSLETIWMKTTAVAAPLHFTTNHCQTRMISHRYHNTFSCFSNSYQSSI